jgi:arabinose-5-phosphate isomerase
VTSSHFESAKKTFAIEADALNETASQLDRAQFGRACETLLATKGRVIVTGMGKSGHIARKIASTLSSTGTPALFLHPTEASHGDIGLLQSGDVIIMLSKSGEFDELSAILPVVSRKQTPIIAITCNPDSQLAKAANHSGGAVLLVHVRGEACPHDLAPTASSTASLAMGDALAIALLEARNFSSEDFARLHPAGALGRKLTFSVSDLMVTGASLPVVQPNAPLTDVIREIGKKRLGATAVVDNEGELQGIITDGDLRRYLESHEELRTKAVVASEIMTRNPRTTTDTLRAIEALELMEHGTPKVMQLIILDGEGKLCGMLHLHDIVRAGIS